MDTRIQIFRGDYRGQTGYLLNKVPGKEDQWRVYLTKGNGRTAIIKNEDFGTIAKLKFKFLEILRIQIFRGVYAGETGYIRNYINDHLCQVQLTRGGELVTVDTNTFGVIARIQKKFGHLQSASNVDTVVEILGRGNYGGSIGVVQRYIRKTNTYRILLQTGKVLKLKEGEFALRGRVEKKRITVKANPNKATIIYWGKRDFLLNLPTNSSFSVSLDYFHTVTTVERNPLGRDVLVLNGQRTLLTGKMYKVINYFRGTQRESLMIHSDNNFPTAAGMASSASGYAALTFALAHYFNSPLKNNLDHLSAVARQGSGSAARSLHGGFVQWQRGNLNSGIDSLATQCFPANHWDDLCVVVFVVDEEQKKVPSTSGMIRTVKTSTLFKERLKNVGSNMTKMIQAVNRRNFPAFAKLTMKDSNEFHAVCLDSSPPIRYLTDASFSIMDFVHQFNTKQVRAAYSFDAGANAMVFTLREHLDELLTSSVNQFCAPSSNVEQWITDPFDMYSKSGVEMVGQCSSQRVQKLIVTRVGSGVKVISEQL